MEEERGMSKPPARFTQAEVLRVIRALEIAGLQKRVRIDAAGDIWIEPMPEPNAKAFVDVMQVPVP
jgi:hypothetical protein